MSGCCRRFSSRTVSVLFSEPKIPQNLANAATIVAKQLFQCSSASRKFLKRALSVFRCSFWSCFSALQRAENSSNVVFRRGERLRFVFQCSSASRKFLKPLLSFPTRFAFRSFSALQRAENSSNLLRCGVEVGWVVFQCSSASRKFLKVLRNATAGRRWRFQCSSASRKFLKSARRR